jgi:beta-glucosidase
VGYRWFDKHQIEPLFPFGYGLSYSKFKYSDLQVSQARDGGADLRFQITNTGDVESDEVAQAYLGAPRERPAGVQFSDRILAAFTRVHLAPGQSLPVLLHISQRQFQYWSTASQSWRTPGGEREVFVGASSRDLRLKTVIP